MSDASFLLSEDEFDKLTLVLGLVQYGWSFRKVGRVISADGKTVKSLYCKALKLKEAGELCKYARSERKIRLRYVGNTSNLEYVDGKVNNSEAGGGKRIKQIKYNDNWEVE